jgi:hypothetical protein
MRPMDIAKTLKIGRASVYCVLGQKSDNGSELTGRSTG